MTTPKTQTFATPEAAIANARKLFAAGEIDKDEFTSTVRKMQEAQLKKWLDKTYGDGK